ncbi:MAG: tetratricopeptide repeat protein [Thiothrix sp.]|nr:MAG: tetratricopeptide repeat protein [Thiothrix sp.]
MSIHPSKMVLRYAPLAVLAAGLAGCAPALPPEPIYAAPPQAMPLTPMPPQMQQPIPQPMPLPQPPRQQTYNPPPTVTPIEPRTKVVAEPLPEPSAPPKSTAPSVTYIPEKQTAPSAQSQTSPAKPTGVPFWDQGKVQVEVMDLPAEKQPAPTVNPSLPPQTGLGTPPSSTSTSSSTSSSSQSTTSTTSSPAVAVLLKQANNELSVGKADRAATTLERALRIAPNDANLWLRLAEVNEQLGNKSQASSMARKALDLAPDDAAIRLRAQRLVN